VLHDQRQTLDGPDPDRKKCEFEMKKIKDAIDKLMKVKAK